jgi:phytoene synthase
MRALPWHCARDQVYVPEDILAKRGVRREQLIGGEAGDETRAALADLRAIARKHLEAAFSELRSLMQKSRPVLLPISLCEPYLRLMETALYDPFKTIVELPQWKKQWILWRAARNWG